MKSLALFPSFFLCFLPPNVNDVGVRHEDMRKEEENRKEKKSGVERERELLCFLPSTLFSFSLFFPGYFLFSEIWIPLFSFPPFCLASGLPCFFLAFLFLFSVFI